MTSTVLGVSKVHFTLARVGSLKLGVDKHSSKAQSMRIAQIPKTLDSLSKGNHAPGGIHPGGGKR
jgi:hypothetical protein